MYTLLQCSVCEHKSYIFCCFANTEVLFTVCQTCVVEQVQVDHNCNRCEASLIREVADLRTTLIREMQTSKRNSGRVNDPWTQPPNLNIGKSHHTYPPAKTGNNFMKQSNAQRPIPNQAQQIQNNIFSSGLGKNQMFNQTKTEQPRTKANNLFSGFNGPVAQNIPKVTPDMVRMLNRAAEAPVDRAELIKHQRTKSGVTEDEMQTSKYYSDAESDGFSDFSSFYGKDSR